MTLIINTGGKLPVDRSFHGINTWKVINVTNIADIEFKCDVQILWVHVIYASSNVVGNRWIRLGLIDSDNVEYVDTHSGQQQTANLTRHYLFIQGTLRESNFVDTEIICAMPKYFFVTEGWKLRMGDSADVSTADTFTALIQTKMA